MKALTLDAEHKTAYLTTLPTPTPSPTDLLVNITSISLNPIDPLYVAHPLGATGRVLGSDFSGTIASLGTSVPASSGLKPGDHVAGFLQGACSANERPGAFADYALVPWDLVWKVPDRVGLEEASGVSLVALTAAQGVWYRLGLRAPFEFNRDAVLAEHPEWATNYREREEEDLAFFIYGASTSVALYAAQFVRLSALASGRKIRLFGAASKARWQFLKDAPYGYDGLVDYRDADWPAQIRALAGGRGVDFAYDCISEADSVVRVSSTLADGGKVAIVRSRAGGAWKADDLPVEPIYGAVWEGLGEEVQYQGFTVKKSVAAREFAVEFYKWLGRSVGSQLVPNPIRLMPGGLEKVVEDGFALLGPGRMEDRGEGRTEEWMRPVSAEKLVYKI